MKCISCGKGELIHDTRDLAYAYRGETTILPAVTGHFCTACSEVVHERDESARVSEMMLHFNKQVNATAVEPELIAGIRKKLNLDTREAAEIFGGGINAFARYESGKARPTVAMIRLMRLLDRHPELLEEVRAEVTREKAQL